MPTKNRFLGACYLALFCCVTLGVAQERPRTVGQSGSAAAQRPVEDVMRVNTRAVFIDTLVRDSKTNEPVRDMKAEDFQVFDDGKPRKLSYFTREGDTRRPLALLLFIDLWTQYGKSHLKSSDAMRRLASALTKLAPEDQVAVMVTWIEEGQVPGPPLPKVRMVENFTRDREKAATALLSVPELIRQQEQRLEEISQRSARAGGDSFFDIVWSLSDVASQVIPLAAEFPNSQFAVVGVIADLFDLERGEREEAAETAIRAGITFNGLVFKKSLAGKMFFGTVNKVFMGPRGRSVRAADYLAKQTGGEVASVGQPDDLASGLEGFISSLMARYNLGFNLEEHEQDDGRMHTLEVRIKPSDSRGKQRKLLVKARRGYYTPLTR
ncbi:MAG: VWA domain-containing protein [Acidobacteria bacterium]|nr:VWA domain-containing protein [Acidobacteriota bacterium]